MRTRAHLIMICVIGFLWLTTSIYINGSTSSRYISLLLQENEALAMPEGYSHSAGMHNAVDLLINAPHLEASAKPVIEAKQRIVVTQVRTDNAAGERNAA